MLVYDEVSVSALDAFYSLSSLIHYQQDSLQKWALQVFVFTSILIAFGHPQQVVDVEDQWRDEVHLSLPQKIDHMNLLGYRKSFHQIDDKFTELCEFKCDE